MRGLLPNAHTPLRGPGLLPHQDPEFSAMGRHTSWDHMRLFSKSPGQQELAAVQVEVNAPACVQMPIPTAACRVVLVKRFSL